MVGCSGYLHGLSETGILDCVLYMAGKIHMHIAYLIYGYLFAYY